MFHDLLPPFPLHDENLRPVFWKSISGRLPALPWTLVRLDFHSICVILLLFKKKNMVGFLEVGALVAKTIEKGLKLFNMS